MVSLFGIDIIEISWIILILFWIATGFFAKKAVTKKRWNWRIFIILAYIVFIIYNKNSSSKIDLLFTTQFLFETSHSLQIAGVVITLLGLFGALWARIYLGRNWSSYVTYKKDHELVTTGPYRFIRHPIYTGILTMGIGTFIYTGFVFVAIYFIIMFGIFIWRIGKEEEIMIKLFGDRYKDYMKKTKRLIPWVY